jgi:hypothetical protein
MTRALATAAASCAVVVALAVTLGGGGAVAQGTPTPAATGAAPITVVIPGTASPTPTPSTTLPTLPLPEETGVPGEPGACVPGSANADGSPVPPASPHDADEVEELDLSAQRLTAESWVIASAPGFLAGELGQVVLYPGADVVGSYTVGSEGEFAARFRIPADTAPGTHAVEVTGWVSGCVASAEFTVIAAPSSANWLTLWWVWIVLGALLLGVISLLIGFRKDLARWFARTPAGTAA